MDYKQIIITKTSNFVKDELKLAESGHDWWHAIRVKNMALKIAETEGGDKFIIELSSLLHDIADSKFYDGNENIGPHKAFEFLHRNNIDSQTKNQVIDIIKNISFRGGVKNTKLNSIEFKIVQDADRLDAIGAIGIARAFSYGGYNKRLFYDPQIPPITNLTTEEYKKSTAPTINHFYEKLLLLKDKMNTETAKQIAQERHHFVEVYLNQFYAEWNCKL
jgi:uncharacterized protein